MAGRKIKKGDLPHHNRSQVYMRLVTSDTCIACKQRCARGIEYMKRMEIPGSVGKGVPCILKSYRLKA